MTYQDNGGSAFPGKAKGIVGRRCGIPVEGDVYHPGMTLRDWFAGQALTMIKTNDIENNLSHIAAAAYAIADAMLAARNTTNINKENEE